MSEIHPYIVVGSGCTGAMAAQTLVEAGVKVLMLDAGNTDDTYEKLIPEKDFTAIRQTEETQGDYLLGKKFESISWANIGSGSQLTPPRKYMVKEVEKFLEIVSQTFFPVQSLAYGGLGNGWGLGSCVFSGKELEAAGLHAAKMNAAYQTVANRIGISGAQDDIAAYTTAHLNNIMPPAPVDSNQEHLRTNYNRKKEWFAQNNFFLGRTALALITKDKDHRKAYQPKDLDFYSDKDQSAYRPWITVNELKKKNNFTYKGGIIVKQFNELENGEVEIITWNKQKNEEEIFRTQKLVLAPGVLATARIILRSFPEENQTLPLLCNPYAYFPCINVSQLGKTFERNTSGFAQLSLFHDSGMQGDDIAMASLYSYKSLMLFRIIKEAPVNFRDGISLMNFLMPAFVIMGLFHPEKSGGKKSLSLLKDTSKITGDSLQAEYLLSETEKQKISGRNRLFKKAMSKLGAYPVKMIDPGMGSSIHYAGVLPFEKQEKPFTLSPDGKLRGTKNIFVADGSGFRFLPAKGLTLSLMANAHNVAQNALIQY
ncbi:MAG: hypothetical protein POELPBGB_02287 [Bacteroidia bacterium]|nr:hypothetical protein [Bacteroidia bacterium]